MYKSMYTRLLHNIDYLFLYLSTSLTQRYGDRLMFDASFFTFSLVWELSQNYYKNRDGSSSSLTWPTLIFFHSLPKMHDIARHRHSLSLACLGVRKVVYYIRGIHKWRIEGTTTYGISSLIFLKNE